MTRPRRSRTGADAIGGQPAVRAPRRAPFVVLVALVLVRGDGASEAEVTANSRAASVRLRAVERVRAAA